MTMPSTTGYDFGNVVLVAFPFTNLQSTKRRPAVILSSRAYQQTRPDVILMAVTSQVRTEPGFGEAFLHGWQAAGLAKPSILKPLIATLEKNRIIKVMGRLSDSDLEGLTKALGTIIGH